MRIMHLNDVAGTACVLRDAQRALGHSAEVLQTWRGTLHYEWPEDMRFYGDRGPLAAAHLLAGILVHARTADVLHIHGPFPFVRMLLLLRRPIVWHLKGDDARGGTWRFLEGRATFWVSTPDLLRHVPAATYVPNPVAVPRADAYRGGQRPRGRRFRVVHAHARHADLEAVKGTETIRRAVAEAGAELLEVEGMPRRDALAAYATADLAVDQLRLPWYGMFAAECMAMGVPVVGRVDRSVPYANPVYPAGQDLAGTITELLEDADLRRSVARKQRDLVRARHDPTEIARWTVDNYPVREDGGPLRPGAWWRDFG